MGSVYWIECKFGNCKGLGWREKQGRISLEN